MVDLHWCDEDFDNCSCKDTMFAYPDKPTLVTKGALENANRECFLCNLNV